MIADARISDLHNFRFISYLVQRVPWPADQFLRLQGGRQDGMVWSMIGKDAERT